MAHITRHDSIHAHLVYRSAITLRVDSVGLRPGG